MTKPGAVINKRKIKSKPSSIKLTENVPVGKKTKTKTDTDTETKIYTGLSGYEDYTKTLVKSMQGETFIKNTASQKHIKVPTRVDYHPELCKDYLETGFCGFGDSCKFLHDRSDYKSGWELEEEYNKKNEEKDEEEYKSAFVLPEEALLSAEEEEEEKKENDVTLCLYCRREIRNAVQTNCGHNYCQECAIAVFKSDSVCVACGEKLDGTMKPVVIEKKKVEKKVPEKQEEVAIVNLVEEEE